MEAAGMRLKEADCPVDVVPASRLHIHNVGRRDRNRNQSATRDKLPDSAVIHCSTQWANNYTSPSTEKELLQLTNNSGSNYNNNITTTTTTTTTASLHSYSTSSEFLSESSPDDSLGDFEDGQQSCSSSLDVSPQGDEYRCFDLSDSDSLSDDGNALQHRGGIVNPNYPGFQHLAHRLQDHDVDDEEEEEDSEAERDQDNNNNDVDSINHLDSVENFQKAFYDKPKFNIPVDEVEEDSVVPDVEKDLNVHYSSIESGEVVVADLVDVSSSENQVSDPESEEAEEVLASDMAAIALQSGGATGGKMSDAFLSGAKEELLVAGDSNRVLEEWEDRVEKFSKEEQTAGEKEKDEDSVVPRKKEKMEINYNVKKNSTTATASATAAPNPPPPQQQSGAVLRRRSSESSSTGSSRSGGRAADLANRRSVPAANRDKKRSSTEILGGFDVYNIETAMPKIDLDAIESHLRAAREEERRRRNDREEIRRRLAMGSDTDEYYGGERPGRKPSLQARLQSGMNLQICFMNETVSDTESPSSDTETSPSPVKSDPDKMTTIPRSSAVLPKATVQATPPPAAAAAVAAASSRPSTSLLTLPLRKEPEPVQPMTEADFFACQARLQAEARLALAQAKEMAHMQMEVERQRQKKSPITEMVRSSLEKVGIPFPEDRRRVSRQILTEMNVAQLQVIVNDLHTQIEILNEGLVKFLMDRDDLHMEQDSMLVDIEDLTRYLGAKEQSVKEHKDVHLLNQSNNNNNILPTKTKCNRIVSLVKK